MKNSKQRQSILKAVQNSCNHPTAEMIHSIVKTDICNISLGTVYRNLNKLSEEGFIKKVSLFNDSDRFDKLLYDHYHMVCTKCNNIYDIKSETTLIKKMLEKKNNLIINECNIALKGICDKCANNNQ